MASMGKRGSRRQYGRTAIAAACLSSDCRNVSAWPEQEWLSSTGSPP
jgi:hypothetical protein